MSIEQIISAIERVTARKARTKLPKRFDTRPIKFEVFHERECKWCGRIVNLKKRYKWFCCPEHEQFWQELSHSAAKKDKIADKKNHRPRNPSSRAVAWVRELPDRFTPDQAAEVWKIHRDTADSRLERALRDNLVQRVRRGIYRRCV